MIIAAAQTHPVQGALHDNLEEHFELIQMAAEQQVELILFPELSLSGYVREDGQRLSLTIYDACINILRDYAREYNMTIVAGAPAKIKSDLFIGSFILTNEGGVDIYTKQYLHEGEELYYHASFEHNPIIHVGQTSAALAICADIENPLHSADARKSGAQLYLASIFYTTKSMAGAHQKLSEYARKQNMNILMSNFCGQSYGMDAGGESAFWNSEGQLVAKLDGKRSGILVINEKDNIWSGKALYKNNI